MRTLLVLFLLAVGLSFAHAQSVRIDRVDVMRPGIFVAESKTKAITDKNISTGQRTETKSLRNIEVTTLIPARNDTFFGLEGVLVGSPKGERVPVRVVWRYPEPGLTNPQTGVTKYVDDYTDYRIIGDTFTYYWFLGNDWTLVPGVWTFELWYGDRRLVSQRFTLVRP